MKQILSGVTVALAAFGLLSLNPVLADDAKPAPPELTGLSARSAPPGTTITISGKNFSPKVQTNKVMFGGTEATASAANATSITVTIPEMDYPQNVEVTVTANGVKSSNQLPMQISNREY